MKKVFKIVNTLFGAVLWLVIILLFLAIGLMLTIHLSNSNPQAKIRQEAIQEYNYLKSLLDEPDKKVPTTTDGHSNFVSSEWPFMTLSMSTFGMRNLALYEPSLKEAICIYMKKAIERAMKPEYYHFILEHYGDPFRSEKIEDNAFYLGHLTLMLAYYREISGDDCYDELLHKFARAFYDNCMRSPTRCVTSYSNFTWTSEQVIPLKALKIYDDIFGTNYKEAIFKWRDTMQGRFIESESGLMVTCIDHLSGFIFEGARTIPNALTILLLYDAIPDFCRTLYVNMKKELLIRRLGFPLFKEYIGTKQVPTGDTGPIVWGTSPVSTAFGMGCVGLMGDDEVFLPINYLSDVIGLGVRYQDKRKYLAGGQIGTACMFWLKTMHFTTPHTTNRIPLRNMAVLYLIIIAIIALGTWRLRVLFRMWKQITE